MKSSSISGSNLDYRKAFDVIETQIRDLGDGDDIRSLKRLRLRRRGLAFFQMHGLEPRVMIPQHNLRTSYRGKVMLLHISGGIADGLVCLRGGDDWHREILENTREEVLALGFDRAEVMPAGGAVIRFGRDGTIILSGSSEEYGTCDKNRTADLIQEAFPGQPIFIRP